MKTHLPTKAGRTVKCDAIYALYGLDGRIQPAVGTDFRIWVASHEEDAEARRAALALTAALSLIEAQAVIEAVAAMDGPVPDDVPVRVRLRRGLDWDAGDPWQVWRKVGEIAVWAFAVAASTYVAVEIGRAILSGRIP